MESYIVFIGYFIVILAVAAYGFKVTKSNADYILGGRKLSGVVAAMGVGASDMSGWLMLGLPGAVYLLGLNQVWMPIGLVIGAYLNWLLVAKRLRIYTELANDSLTIPAYFQNRFVEKKPYIRMTTALVVLVFFTFYAAAGFVGGANTFMILFDVSYLQALLITALVVVLYSCIGGFLVVSWLDLLQGFLMLFALLCAAIFAFSFLGGILPVIDTVASLSGEHLELINNVEFIAIVSLLAWGLGYFGQPHILVRFMAAKRPRDLKLARNVCMSWMIMSLICAVSVGLVGGAYYKDAPLENAETVFLNLGAALFHPFMAAIVFAGVLSAIMSTIAAQLLASGSALEEDLYHPLLRPQAAQTELIWVARLTVLIVAGVAFCLALDPASNILALVSYAWAGLGAAFGPVIVLSLYWRRMTAKGAVTGMISGAAVVILWHKLGDAYGGIFTIYELLPGFICGVVAIILTSLIDKPSSIAVLKQFDRFRRQVNCKGNA